jgi:hypothetical protein
MAAHGAQAGTVAVLRLLKAPLRQLERLFMAAVQGGQLNLQLDDAVYRRVDQTACGGLLGGLQQ